MVNGTIQQQSSFTEALGLHWTGLHFSTYFHLTGHFLSMGQGAGKRNLHFFKKIYLYFERESLHMRESGGGGGQWERICKQTPC